MIETFLNPEIIRAAWPISLAGLGNTVLLSLLVVPLGLLGGMILALLASVRHPLVRWPLVAWGRDDADAGGIGVVVSTRSGRGPCRPFRSVRPAGASTTRQTAQPSARDRGTTHLDSAA